ncbi:hypothetical protein POM88_018267 [Heracleum sosnowskyi]|uniref:Ubiquitin-like protease family profile domain-containing protein n=1 Tax=Heracleum sosnowskyi TaxID=360622 RepID=A0AAD8IS46_9APIA|nr:hypothetical protein POM88_018267 [Heracleum sosnowskyi]
MATSSYREKRDLASVPSFSLGPEIEILSQLGYDSDKENEMIEENEAFLTPKLLLREKSTRLIKVGPYVNSPYINRVIDINGSYTTEDITMWRFMLLKERDKLDDMLSKYPTRKLQDIDMKPAFEIIDNMKREEEPKLYYGKIPSILHSHFVKYLQLKGFQVLSQMILKLKPSYLSMPWQIKSNSADCGIFVMRHMETYCCPVIIYCRRGVEYNSIR